jgi:ligand-binding sensor domain-containing protein/signal transduction histidine kinase/DNA-binding response OmpR family regulator
MKVLKKIRAAFSLILFMLFNLGQLVIAQNTTLDFEHISVENGLSQSGVISIAQDKMGFMWFGTRDGLNKYDGQHFTVFKNSSTDSTSISSGLNIYALLNDSKGNLWIGTSNGLNLYVAESNSFKRFMHEEKNENSISNNTIRCIFEDKKGTIWIGTDNGLNKLITHNKFEHFSTKKGLSNNFIKVVYESKAGDLWVGTGKGLNKISFKNENYSNKIILDLDNSEIASIAEDDKNNLWFGSHNAGFSVLNYNTQTFTFFLHKEENKNSLISNIVRKILFTKDGKLWIATIKGINIYDPNNNTFQLLQTNSDNPKSLNQNSIYDIFEDKAGTVWIGAYYGGINVLYANSSPFNIYKYKTAKNSLSSNVVRPIAEDAANNLWIGTEGEGLNKYNSQTGVFKIYKNSLTNPASLSSNLVKCISIDKNNKIWIGSHDGGLDYLSKDEENFIHYNPDPSDILDMHSKSLVCLLNDSKGRFWVGTLQEGLFLFDPQKNKFQSLLLSKIGLTLDAKSIKSFFEDSKQNIWIATVEGLFFLGKNESSIKQLPIENASIRILHINSIHEDSKKNIWIGTYENGLILYDKNKATFKRYTQADGLPSNNVLEIIEDNSNNLWITTTNGLSKFNNGIFKNYTVQDGLPGNVFNNNSALKNSKGQLYFGGYNGLISFNPADVKENSLASPIVFTNLKLFNKPVSIGDATALLKQNINLTKAVTFSYDQNIFTVEFALLNFIKSEKNKYAYQLDNFEKEWNYVDKPSATFTNLSPGTYKLLVKASNNDGVWNTKTAELLIIVKPPYWKTWWAYIIYAAIFASLLFIIVRYILIKASLKKEHEVYQMKLDFFTNVSHEIRTPLTLIIGPLENLLQYTQDNQFLNRQLLLVKSNANRLARLVNELLDFRKAESGKLTLNIAESNIVVFVKEIYFSFQHLALEHQITYEFESEKTELPIFFDKEQLEKVLFNLLSNAFKFTQDGGKIMIIINERSDSVDIKIKDTGKGITAENKDKIFTNFFQVPDLNSRNIGSGIGLALAKKIALLHEGDLILEDENVHNDVNPGSSFVLIMKKGSAHFSEKDINHSTENIEDPSQYKNDENVNIVLDDIITRNILEDGTTEKQTILIVEDNADLRTFIKQSLANHFNIVEAENGLRGWDIAVEQIPDLIISDVMMPQLDGLELCRRLKTDDRTSHIPVILLTARSGKIHEVSGLKTGTDVYLIKPFNVQILALNINNLLVQREKLRKKFSQQMTLEPTNIIIESNDKEFLEKVIQTIENNLSNENFGVHELSAAIGMSSPVFYKKIKSLADMSVNNLIKTVRLNRAAQLLQQNFLNVNEIAFEVGFNDTRYFSREFRKQFGENPSKYVESKNGERSDEL